MAAPDSELLEDLVFRCLEADDPHAALSELESEHPEMAGRIRRVVDSLERQGLLDAVAVDVDEVPERLGPFRLGERLGSGGMGVVYLAEDDSLGRTVALKLIRPDQMFFPGARERFQREVETVARLQHPGIVPVYAVGKQDGVPYFTMERVNGCSLAVVIDELADSKEVPSGRRLLDIVARHAGVTGERDGSTSQDASRGSLQRSSWPDTCVSIAVQIADALHYAHERGVLHRDVKPSNVLVTPDGRARLVDFGLAWTEQADQRLTHSKSQLGSLPYLPPEYVSGKMPEPSRRVDVYSLGVTLYELLALRNPFLADNPEETRRRIVDATPPPLRRRDRTISPELATACLAAMDPDPAERYATAAAFSDDLGRVLRRESIVARRPSPALRARRWVQRHPTFAVAIALTILLVAIGSIGYAARERRARIAALQLTEAAEQERYSALLVAANIELGATLRPGVARRLLKACRERDRGWEWRFLEFLSDESVAPGLDAKFETPVADVEWSPDGERLVVALDHGPLLFVDRDGQATRAEMSELSVTRIAFRPGSKQSDLVTGDSKGRVRLWNATNGQLLATIARKKGVGAEITAIACTPDGKRCFTTAGDGRVEVWDLERREWIATVGKHGMRAQCVDVSRDGRRLASGGFDGRVQVYDATTLQPITRYRTMGIQALDLKFTPDGEWLYIGDSGPLRVYRIDDAAASPRFVPGSRRRTMALELSSDGKMLAAVVGKRLLQLYRVDSNAPGGRPPVREFRGDSGLVMQLAFHPLGTSLATGGTEPGLRVWQVDYGAALRQRNSFGRSTTTAIAAVAPGVLVYGDIAGRCGLTEIDAGVAIRLPTGHKSTVFTVHPTEEGWLSVDANGRVEFWGLAKRELLRTFATVPLASVAAVGQDGRVLAVATEGGTVALYELPGGELQREFRTHGVAIRALAWHPRRPILWTGAKNGELSEWNAATGTRLRRLPRHPEWISTAVAAPDGTWLATGCGDTLVRVIDVATGSVRHELRGHGNTPLALAVTPDGQRLVSSGGYDNELRIWQPVVGRGLLSLVHGAAVTALAFSADGEQLLCGKTLGRTEWLSTRPGGPRPITESKASIDTMTGPLLRRRHLHRR